MRFMRNRAITDYKTSTSGAIGTGRGPRWWYLKAPRRARQESAQSKSIRQSSGSSTHFFRPASSACENHSSSTSTIDRRGARNRRAASRCGYLRARVTFGIDASACRTGACSFRSSWCPFGFYALPFGLSIACTGRAIQLTLR